MRYWLLAFQNIHPDVALASSGPYSDCQVDEAAEILLADCFDGVYVFDRKPNLNEAAVRVADGREIASMEGFLRIFVEDTDEVPLLGATARAV